MWFVGHDFSDASIVAKENTKPDMEIVTRVIVLGVPYRPYGGNPFVMAFLNWLRLVIYFK